MQFFPFLIEFGYAAGEEVMLFPLAARRFVVGKESGVGHARLQFSALFFQPFDLRFQLGKPFLPLPFITLPLLLLFAPELLLFL